MARRQQRRRPAFRATRAARSEDDAAAQAMLDANARRLLAAQGARVLPGLVQDLRQLRDDADRQCYEQPSPEALAAFRRADRELTIAERALALAGPDD